MRAIRLIQVGETNNTLIHNLGTLLERVQDVYSFIFEDDVIIPDPEQSLPDGAFLDTYIERLVKEYMHQHDYGEFPLVITDCHLPDEIYSSSNDEICVISTHGWSTFSQYPLIKGLEYLTAAILLDMHLTTDAHYDTRGCPNDFCDNLSDIDVGLRKCEFCDACKRAILSAIETGKITLAQSIAIHRILDDVAGRTICFVLMPFREEFDEPYAALKDVIGQAGLTCIRADEIFETRSIIQIIYEMIGRAEVIVADLTGRNPNVFYELGYAHAIGRNTILITQNPDDIPFDLRHRQYVSYGKDSLDSTLKQCVRGYLR